MKTNSLSRKLAWTLFAKMIAAAILLLFSGIGIYILSTFAFAMFTWQGDEPLYRLAMNLQQHLLLVAFAYYGIGLVVIFFHYWFKPFRNWSMQLRRSTGRTIVWWSFHPSFPNLKVS